MDRVGKNEIGVDEFADTLTSVQQLESEDWLIKADRFSKSENYNEALKCYDLAIEFNHANFDALRERGMLLQNLSYHRDAIKDFTQVIIDDPKDFNIIYLRGCSFLSICDYENASVDITNAIQLSHSATQEQKQLAKSKGFDSLESMYQKSIDLINVLKDSPKEIIQRIKDNSDKMRKVDD